MKRPIIAITLDYCEDSEGLQYSARPWHALRCDYSRTVADLGGVPLLIPYEKYLIDDVLAMVDGLIIPGGDLDIHPKFYGQDITSPKVRPSEVRSEYDIAIAKRAIALKIPFIGICFGMQALNVAAGGTLIQDIETTHKSNIDHHILGSRHPITIANNTILSKLEKGQGELIINTHHHQAIDKLGKGLKVAAKAPDGIIEAIEIEDHPFGLGIEWHPEYMDCELDKSIMKAFMKAASSRA